MSHDLLMGVAFGVFSTLLLLGVVVWFGLRWIRGRLPSGLQPARPRPLKGWDYRMRLRTLKGEFVEASTFREQTLFLNFWATWCAPCVAELPSIERLIDRLADANVAFACVTTEPIEKVNAFIYRKPPRIPIYVLADDKPPIFETRSIPATFIVRDGDIISQHMGAARWDTDEMVTLLAGSPVLPSAKLRANWERRLPPIEVPWTHWRLFGEGGQETLIADVPAEDVAGAVRLVASNYRAFSQIFAVVIRFASDGSCVSSKTRTVISSSTDLESEAHR